MLRQIEQLQIHKCLCFEKNVTHFMKIIAKNLISKFIKVTKFWFFIEDHFISSLEWLFCVFVCVFVYLCVSVYPTDTISSNGLSISECEWIYGCECECDCEYVIWILGISIRKMCWMCQIHLMFYSHLEELLMDWLKLYLIAW